MEPRGRNSSHWLVSLYQPAPGRVLLCLPFPFRLCVCAVTDCSLALVTNVSRQTEGSSEDQTVSISWEGQQRRVGMTLLELNSRDGGVGLQLLPGRCTQPGAERGLGFRSPVWLGDGSQALGKADRALQQGTVSSRQCKGRARRTFRGRGAWKCLKFAHQIQQCS